MAKSGTPLTCTTGQDDNVDGNSTSRCDLVGDPNPGYCLFVRFKDGLARLCLRPAVNVRRGDAKTRRKTRRNT